MSSADCLVTQSCLAVCDPMDCGSSVPGFFRQDSWHVLPLPPPGDLPDPGIKLAFPELQVLYLLSHAGSRMCLAAAAAKSLQSRPILCDPTDGGPPGFPVPGILQARTLEWGAMSFSNA